MSGFLDGGEPALCFTDRKLQSGSMSQPWSIEELVEAQNMDCAGVPFEQIAAALRRSLSEVIAKLDPRPCSAGLRPERAGLGFANLKVRR